MTLDRRIFLALFSFAMLLKDIKLLQASEFPTRQSPLIADKNLKSVLIYTGLNLKSAFSENPHLGIVARNGKLQDKAILKAFADASDFHDALISIGARSGNNLTEAPVHRELLDSFVILTKVGIQSFQLFMNFLDFCFHGNDDFCKRLKELVF